MSRLISSFESVGLNRMLSRAGALNEAPRPAAASVVPSRVPAPVGLVEQVKAVKEPGERALGAALSALVGDLSRVLSSTLFVADQDGLLLAGHGHAPALAASVAADASRSLNARAGMTAAQVDGLLLRADPHNFLVFSCGPDKRPFVVGAQINDEVSVVALRTAVDRIVQTLAARLAHA